ncbi:Lpp/OprI family alanine-zipper lipoprotein [Pseudomonas japonica]|uniref:Lpp/OprI family alanine-zipper lipoprotein n=1 Tax=Pseudomonas japonica TaxID=256466 RepID=UPI0015E33C6C|nr:Lpp/OprI family alanine-zipper lipoprotein [Pseudomonas japonica]MBA1242758.1 outer membrane lipoprotein OprI [Pseudomonas japonica]MBA1290626.1 outer membrane lipoprotein OprI [Pseudomonas japonica]
MKITPMILLAALTVAMTTGCSHRHHEEMGARVEAAENAANTARVRADEAYEKADMALGAANQAQRTADEANERANRMMDRASRK